MSDDKVAPTPSKSALPGEQQASEVEKCPGAHTATSSVKPKKKFRAACKRMRKRIHNFFRRLRPRKKKKFKKFEPDSQEEGVQNKEGEHPVPVITPETQTPSGSKEGKNLDVVKKSRHQLNKLELLQMFHGISVAVKDSISLKAEIPLSDISAAAMESVFPDNCDKTTLYWHSSSTSLTVIHAERSASSLTVRAESRNMGDADNPPPIWCSTPACLIAPETVDNIDDIIDLSTDIIEINSQHISKLENDINKNDDNIDDSDEEYNSDEEEEELTFLDRDSLVTHIYVDDEAVRCESLPNDLVENAKQKKRPPLSLATIPPLVRSASAPLPLLYARNEPIYFEKLRKWVKSVEILHWRNMTRYYEEATNFHNAMMRAQELNITSWSIGYSAPRLQFVQLQAKRIPEEDEQGIRMEEENLERKEFEQEMKVVDRIFAYEEALKAPIPPMPGVWSIEPRGVEFTEGNIDRLVLGPYSPVHPEDADISQPVPRTPSPPTVIALPFHGLNNKTNKENNSWAVVPWKPDMAHPMTEEPKGKKSPSETELERLLTALPSKASTKLAAQPKAMYLDPDMFPINNFSATEDPAQVLKPELPGVDCDAPPSCLETSQTWITELCESLPLSPEPTLQKTAVSCASLPDVTQSYAPRKMLTPPATALKGSARYKQKISPIKDSSKRKYPLEVLELTSPMADDVGLNICPQTPDDLDCSMEIELVRKHGGHAMETIVTDFCQALIDTVCAQADRPKPQPISAWQVAEDPPSFTLVEDISCRSLQTPRPLPLPDPPPEVKPSLRLNQWVPPFEDSFPKEVTPEVLEATSSKDDELDIGLQSFESPTDLDGSKLLKLSQKSGALEMGTVLGCQAKPSAQKPTLQNAAALCASLSDIAWAKSPRKPNKMSATAVAEDPWSPRTLVEDISGKILQTPRPPPTPDPPPEAKPSVTPSKVGYKIFNIGPQSSQSPDLDSRIEKTSKHEIPLMETVQSPVTPPKGKMKGSKRHKKQVSPIGNAIELATESGQMERVSLPEVARSDSPCNHQAPATTPVVRSGPSLTQMFVAAPSPSCKPPPSPQPKSKKASKKRGKCKISPLNDFKLEIFQKEFPADLGCAVESTSLSETPLVEQSPSPEPPPVSPPMEKKGIGRRKSKVSPMDCDMGIEIVPRLVTPQMDIMAGSEAQPSLLESTLPDGINNCASFPHVALSIVQNCPQTPPAMSAGTNTLSAMPPANLPFYLRAREAPPCNLEHTRQLRRQVPHICKELPHKSVPEIKHELSVSDIEREMARNRLKMLNYKFVVSDDDDDDDLSQQSTEGAAPHLTNSAGDYTEPTPSFSQDGMVRSRFPELVINSGQQNIQSPAELDSNEEVEHPSGFGTAVKKKVPNAYDTLCYSPEPMLPGAAAPGVSIPDFDQNEHFPKPETHSQEPERFPLLRNISRSRRDRAWMMAEMAAEMDEDGVMTKLSDTELYFHYLFGARSKRNNDTTAGAPPMANSREKIRAQIQVKPVPFTENRDPPPLHTKVERRKPFSMSSFMSGLSLPKIIQPKKSKAKTNVTDKMESGGKSELTMTQLVAQTRDNVPGPSSRRTQTTDKHSLTELRGKAHSPTETPDRKAYKYFPFLKKLFHRS